MWVWGWVCGCVVIDTDEAGQQALAGGGHTPRCTRCLLPWSPTWRHLTCVAPSCESALLCPACCLHVLPATDVFMRHQPVIGLALAAAAAIDTDPPTGINRRPAAAAQWQALAGYERQLLLTLPDGTQGREMLVAMLLEAVQAAHPDKVRVRGHAQGHACMKLQARHKPCGDTPV